MKRNIFIVLIITLSAFFIFFGISNPDQSAGFITSESNMCGDVNGNGSINILDVIYIINYIYKGGPPPTDTLAADVNNSGNINILDITYLISFLYKEGPDPVCPGGQPGELPSSFDLRNYDGINYVTSVKNQSGGTCWAHGTMASIESNLLMTGAWADNGESGQPNLAEYHLDWWNGFNDFYNADADPPTGQGIEVHQGGYYLMANAYISRGDGAVRDIDAQSFSVPPDLAKDSYHYYYVRDVEFYIAESDLSRIDTIKRKIMEYGAIATAYSSYGEYMVNYIHYQPPDDPVELNHAVAIVGWNDNLATQAPHPGAWLCKNSWGSGWGFSGYFWISYYDKYCCQEYQLGAVSFQNVEPMKYDIVHCHDYHGWRNNLGYTSYEAFNAFTAAHNERLEAVSICTPEDQVNYTVRIYDTFSGGALSGLLSEVSGNYEYRGFHTVDLTTPVTLSVGNDFYIYMYISYPSLPYDCSTDVPTLLGSSQKVWVPSASQPGQSYYKLGGTWHDLYDYDNSANFCIKGLGLNVGMNVKPADNLESEGPSGGPFEPGDKSYQFSHRYDDPIDYEITIDPSIDWLTLSGDVGGSLPPNTPAEVLVSINGNAEDLVEGIHHGRVYFTNLSDPSDNTSREVTLTVGTPSVRYEWLLDTDPGWTCEGQWAFGVPTGGGGTFGWGVDPTSGHTGDNVYGYNLDGNYPPNLPPTHLYMPALDCTKLFRISLDFWRWLCVDGWGIGYISISTDGSYWYPVYSQTGSLLDNSWNEMSIDISQYADFQSTVYLRFTMEANNATNTFGGWNIDDIQIKAIYDSASTKALQQPVSVNNK
ncbi:MAG: hypothetical protein CVT49_10580 [candidate division Zixibacteria bacterium HGW-Zixibacteria-1]|nr:MAG: hypothetical protein CVT49_10580 [candidate division Zixibacteria bacterium HGW-Zixibacteria-1]